MVHHKHFEISTLRDIYDQARKKELEELKDLKTGYIRADLTENVECALCSQQDTRTIFEKQGFTFVQCVNCHFIYTNPRLTNTKILQDYTHSKSNDIWIDILLTADQTKYNEQKYNFFLDTISRHISPPSRVLDIGCSIGQFMHLAEKRGYECTGLEQNQKAREHAELNYGLTVENTLVEDLDPQDTQYDIITMFGVLEHLPRPHAVLQHCNKLLTKNGFLALLVPNNGSLVARMLHAEAFGVDGRNHLSYFTKRTLRMILENTGFSDINLTTRVSCINPIGNYLNYQDPYFPNVDELDDELLSMISELETIIDKHDMGHHLYATARKK